MTMRKQIDERDGINSGARQKEDDDVQEGEQPGKARRSTKSSAVMPFDFSAKHVTGKEERKQNTGPKEPSRERKRVCFARLPGKRGDGDSRSKAGARPALVEGEEAGALKKTMDGICSEGRWDRSGAAAWVVRSSSVGVRFEAMNDSDRAPQLQLHGERGAGGRR